MERIRKYKNRYQVLITPYNKFDSGFELMLGNWKDGNLRSYNIREYTNMEDAMAEAYNHPELSWYKLIEFHKDIYAKLYKIIKSELYHHDFIVELEPKISTPEELKEIMFDRVMSFGKRFRLSYNLNDIIGYHIINPWSINLKEIYNILRNNALLRIVRYENESGIIRMIGETDIGTNYEIVLWPTLVAHWARWINKNNNISQLAITESLKDILKTQEKIDESINIR